MIDIHTHIIQNVDDGPTHLEQAIEMARHAAASGVSAIIATPHMYDPPTQKYLYKIQEQFDLLRRTVEVNRINISLHLGAEIYLHPDLPAILKKLPQLSFDNQGRVVLVELPMRNVPSYAEQIIYELAVEGVIPVIAHPERCVEIQKKPDRLWQLINKGAQIQMNAGSLMGNYGRKAKKAAKYLLQNGLVNVIASDLHTCPNRHPLVEVEDTALKLIDHTLFLRMVETTPGSYLK